MISVYINVNALKLWSPKGFTEPSIIYGLYQLLDLSTLQHCNYLCLHIVVAHNSAARDFIASLACHY